MEKLTTIAWVLILAVFVYFIYTIYTKAREKKESSFLSIDGSYYMVPQWQDSWPLN